jgi:hypothetical protein
MEGIMQLNENSRYEDFVANSYIRTKFMESNEEVKSAILSSASPRHHDDILEIYNEITDLYGIQTEVKSEERRMQTVTEENEKIWKSYNDNDTF